jgi:hypothetical protein
MILARHNLRIGAHCKEIRSEDEERGDECSISHVENIGGSAAGP